MQRTEPRVGDKMTISNEFSYSSVKYKWFGDKEDFFGHFNADVAMDNDQNSTRVWALIHQKDLERFVPEWTDGIIENAPSKWNKGKKLPDHPDKPQTGDEQINIILSGSDGWYCLHRPPRTPDLYIGMPDYCLVSSSANGHIYQGRFWEPDVASFDKWKAESPAAGESLSNNKLKPRLAQE